MGFRQPLDLSGIMPDYDQWLDPSQYAAAKLIQTPSEEGSEPDWDPRDDWLRDPEPQPFRVGYGPAVCSSSVALEPYAPRFSNDVNGYYRALGIPFPYVNATKQQLREAYQALNGQDSVWLTHCFRQLLDPGRRARYDAMPFGELFLEDDLIQNRLKNNATREAYRRAAAGDVSVEPRTVLHEWGMDLIDQDAPEEELDQASLVWQDQGPGSRQWTYAYYLWRTYAMDTDRLARWQQELVSALARRGKVMRFAVGYVGKTNESAVIDDVNDILTIFLHDQTEPSTDLADQVVDHLLGTSRSFSEHSENAEVSMTEAPPQFKSRRGAAAAKKAADSKNVAFGGKLHYLNLKDDGDFVVLRMIDDEPEWRTFDIHPFFPVKKVEGEDKRPDKMTGTCRFDEAFGKYYPDCYCCEAKLKDKFGNVMRAKSRTIARAVLQKPVIGDGSPELRGPAWENKIVGYEDEYREVDEVKDGKATGTKIQELAVVILEFAYTNFFAPLRVIYESEGTVCDRLIKIVRVGTDTDTIYNPQPREPVEIDGAIFQPGHPEWKRYTDAVANIDLDKIYQDKATDEFYARWFDPSKPVPERKDKNGGSNGGGTAATTEGPASTPKAAAHQPTEEQLAAMRARIQPGGAQQQAAEAAAAEEDPGVPESDERPATRRTLG